MTHESSTHDDDGGDDVYQHWSAQHIKNNENVALSGETDFATKRVTI